MFNCLGRQILAKYAQILPKEAQILYPFTSLPTTNPSIVLRRNSSNSAAYQGDGKTTVRVLNQEESGLNLVNTYSSEGFRLNNNLFISGSILLFPTNVFFWAVRRGIDITEESLFVFDLIVPKIKIVIIGYGQYGEPHDHSIPVKLKKKGISCEMLATPNAVTTYNFLVHDSVHVAGAFVPVKDEVITTQRDAYAISHSDRVDNPSINFGGSNYPRSPIYREEIDYQKRIYEAAVKRDLGKKKFDE